MANDNRAEMIVDGDVSPLRQKLRQAANDLKNFGKEGETMTARLSGPLSTLQSKFVAIGAILAGGKIFKDAVNETVKLTEESSKLGRALDISASSASVLREALAAGNTSQEEFLGAAKGLAKQLRTNEDGLQAMGLKTRDAAGHLRPLNDLTFEAIDLLNGYRAGTDRAIAGQTVFGKGFEITSNLALLNKKALEDTAQQMRDLNMVTSVESVAAWQAFDDAGDRTDLTLKGIQTNIGSVLMPVLTDLGNWFSSIGPAAVTVIRGALGGLVSVFHLLTTGVTVLWETLNAMVVTVAEPIRALGVMITSVLKGDFDSAIAAAKGIGPTISEAWGKAMDEMAAKAQGTRDRIWNLFAQGTDIAAPAGGGLDYKAPPDKARAAVEKTNMPQYEAELAALKNKYEAEHELRQFSKEQELAFWQEKLASAEKGSKDALAIAKRTATLEIDIRRTAAKDQRDLDAVNADHFKNEKLAQVAADQQSANFARENGEISKRELIAQEEDFARRRFEIEYAAQMERMALAEQDPTQSPAAKAQLNEQLLELERQYQLAKAETGQKKKKEDGSFNAMFDDVGGAFGKMAEGMILRAQTLRQGLAGVFQSIAQSFIQNVVTKPFAEWVSSQARMLLMKMGFLAQEKAVEAAGAASTAAITATKTDTVVGGNAAQAGSGAAAALASIPYVGPVLALAAMAAVFAAVSGMGKKSAARGYDIPKGLNPLTQLHEEEMVLPQKYANVIRGMTAQGERSGEVSGDINHFHFNGPSDAKSFERWLTKNPTVLAPSLRRSQRNYTPTSISSSLGKVY